jgi:uncharacterized membrane protein YhaH (DUF805 family)
MPVILPCFRRNRDRNVRACACLYVLVSAFAYFHGAFPCEISHMTLAVVLTLTALVTMTVVLTLKVVLTSTALEMLKAVSTRKVHKTLTGWLDADGCFEH